MIPADNGAGPFVVIPAKERVKKSGSGSVFGVIAAPSQGRHDDRQPLAGG